MWTYIQVQIILNPYMTADVSLGPPEVLQLAGPHNADVRPRG